MASKTIIAVAVGEAATADVTFSTAAQISAAKVRPYLTGLQEWLASANRTDPPQPDNGPGQYLIGQHYTVIYRERPVGDANLQSAFQDQIALNADLWFCMSTSIARAADSVAKAQPQPFTKPIVAIVSDPFSETFGPNVCGVSADRTRLAIRCLRQFTKRVAPLDNIFVLHRAGYGPSEKAQQWFGKKIKGVASITMVSIPDTDTTMQMETKIRAIASSGLANKGVLVLPADRFFGVAKLITDWTGTVPTFWSTRDFPTQARGGWGFEQALCGQFMAERVAIIWKNQDDGVLQGLNVLPDPKWEMIEQDGNLKGRPAPLSLAKRAPKRAAPKARAKRPTRKAGAKRPTKR
jgi:hypothetical protein